MQLFMDLKLTYYEPDLKGIIKSFGILSRVEGERVLTLYCLDQSTIYLFEFVFTKMQCHKFVRITTHGQPNTFELFPFMEKL